MDDSEGIYWDKLYIIYTEQMVETDSHFHFICSSQWEEIIIRVLTTNKPAVWKAILILMRHSGQFLHVVYNVSFIINIVIFSVPA